MYTLKQIVDLIFVSLLILSASICYDVKKKKMVNFIIESVKFTPFF